MTTHTAPASITSDGSKDVSKALWNWINGTGNPGDLLKLRSDAIYRCDYRINIDTVDKVIDQNAAQILRDLSRPEWPGWGDEEARWPRTNPILSFRKNARDVEWISQREGARIQGPARKAAMRGSVPYGIKFEAALEAQAAIHFAADATRCGVCVKNIDVGYVHGDFAYWGGGPHGAGQKGCEVTGSPMRGIGGGGTFSPAGEVRDYPSWVPSKDWRPGFHHCGRQMFAFNGYDAVLKDVAAWYGGRSAFDLEPAGGSARCEGTRVTNVKVAGYMLSFIASLGMGEVHDTVFDTVVTDQAIGVTFNHPNNAVRHGLRLLRLKGLGKAASGNCENPKAIISIRKSDGVSVEECYQRIKAGRCMKPIEAIYGAAPVTERANQWIEVP